MTTRRRRSSTSCARSGIEVGTANSEIKIGDGNFPAGSYVIKRDQPYGRLAKNLLERQNYPDPALTTYDDSGWTMGWRVERRREGDQGQGDSRRADDAGRRRRRRRARWRATGTAGLAVAHYGSNNMIAFRYQLKNVPMKIAEKSFTADGVEFPAGSFVDRGAGRHGGGHARRSKQLGLTAAALSPLPTVADARCRRPAHRDLLARGAARRRSAGTATRSTSSAFRST